MTDAGVPYYDNLLDGAGTGVVEAERVYCFDWHRFGEAEWAELGRVYGRLPGEVRYLDVPYRFGSDDRSPPYLVASVEPSGLVVCGLLDEADWLDWDGLFRREARRLPTFDPNPGRAAGDGVPR